MGRHRITAGCGVAVLCLGVGGCSTTMEITISGSLERPTITFSGVGGRPQRVCLDRFSVYQTDATAPRGPVWDVGDIERDCVELTSVTYGRAPAGLPVLSGPAPLTANTEYEFTGAGWTRQIPNVPWYGGGSGARVIFRKGAWRPVVD